MATTKRRQYGRSRHWIYVLALSFAAAACGSGSGSSGDGTGGTGGDDGNDGGNGDGNGDGNGGGSMLEANFASIQENVFTPICTNCHIGASAPLGLRLDEANSYALLVGVQSAQVPVLQRVEPNDPDESYLIRKLEGSASVGERMPLDMTPLPQADIDVIRQWITDGAQPDTPSEPPSEPVRVTSLSPLPDTAEMRLPSSIVAVFDRELDANTLDETTFLVERSGGDGTFGDDNEVALDGAVSVPQANPSTATFDLSGTSSVADTFRVTLVGSEGAAVLDLEGNALDGEFDGSFPSGDGVEGGDFVAHFEVEGIQPTLESIQANVFTPICTACHNGQADTLPGSMDLTSVSTSFMNLVEVPSVQDDSLERVTPGDPDASYLVRKIEGTADTGERMPPFTDPLDEETIAAIREWIGDGADL